MIISKWKSLLGILFLAVFISCSKNEPFEEVSCPPNENYYYNIDAAVLPLFPSFQEGDTMVYTNDFGNSLTFTVIETTEYTHIEKTEDEYALCSPAEIHHSEAKTSYLEDNYRIFKLFYTVVANRDGFSVQVRDRNNSSSTLNIRVPYEENRNDPNLQYRDSISINGRTYYDVVNAQNTANKKVYYSKDRGIVMFRSLRGSVNELYMLD